MSVSLQDGLLLCFPLKISSSFHNTEDTSDVNEFSFVEFASRVR